MQDKSILTIATGKKVYIDMAVNLAMSFLWSNPGSDIRFFIATDQPQWIPAAIREKIEIVNVLPQHGDGFSTKLFIDQFARTRATLFIDADCLIYGKVDGIFEQFAGKSVSAIGTNITEGEFFCDVLQIRKKFGLKTLPCFVGGIYYIEQGETSREIFELARALKTRYDEIGLVRLRGKENEEPLLAIAMASYGQQPVPDDGTIKADRMFYQHITSDVLAGKAHLWNRDNCLFVKEHANLWKSQPLVVHFNAGFAENYEYYAEVVRLQKAVIEHWPAGRASLYAMLMHTLPGKTKKQFKDTLRPIYRKLFGTRQVVESQRI